MSKIRITGDVHGKISQYKRLVKDCERSLQLGDMGFDYAELQDLDPTKHQMVGGNHDNYTSMPHHDLGDFGSYEHIKDAFFVRGAYSIDQKYRTPYIDYWPEEELTSLECIECLELYDLAGPEVVFSHDVPKIFGERLSSPAALIGFGFNPLTFSSRTQNLLTELWRISKPKLWVAGHYHRHMDIVINGCRFICLDELQYCDLILNSEKEVVDIQYV